jgi:diguanylate cyclase (GGDEF)-like protein
MANPASDLRPGDREADCDAVSTPRSPLGSLLESLRRALASPFDQRTLWQLRRQVGRQAALMQEAEAALASAEIFERAARTARMGTWQCDLPSEHLTWSGGTYDLFGLQRSAGLVRRDILKSYSEESLARLQAVRGGAIASGDGFTLDAEIRHPEAGKRWIRITAAIERQNGQAIRLLGVKQDITEEKKTLEHMRHLAEHDVMTGLANRTQFQMRLADICGPDGTGGALMLVDLDGFKQVNDTLGHAIGDECLVEFTRRLSAVCQSAEVVARIGGDEFAVVFGPSMTLQAIETLAQRLVAAARAPMTCSGRMFGVTTSIGFAFAHGETPSAVFTRADMALYAVKAAGGDAYRGALSSEAR